MNEAFLMECLRTAAIAMLGAAAGIFAVYHEEQKGNGFEIPFCAFGKAKNWLWVKTLIIRGVR